MPTQEEQSNKRSPDLWERIVQALPLATAVWAFLSKLTLAWKLTFGAACLLAYILLWLRVRRRRDGRLVIRYPSRLNLTQDEFRGRDTAVDTLIGLIGDHGNVYLLGESGIGKTTLLEWGLLQREAIFADYHRVIKLDSYGSDWIRGPLLAILRDLGALPPHQRVDTDAESLVAKLREAIMAAEKPTLIIFDQFDQYLVASHEHLLRDGVVVDAEGLQDANPFWKCVFELIEGESIKCLFVVETSQYPLAQPFGSTPPVYPLRRLPKGDARELLAKRLQEAGSPIEEPKVSGLIEQLCEDIERPDLLPVELEFALRGLRYIRRTTPQAYGRLKGLPGLIALGVEAQIRAVAELQRFSYPGALSLLLHLLVEEEGKPQPRNLQDLSFQSGGGRSPGDIEGLLMELAKPEFRITKQLPDPTGPPVWTLYHEFLVSVLLRLREIDRQESMALDRAYHGFRKAAPWYRKTRKLLSPQALGRFLFAGWRGRVSLRKALPLLLLSSFAWLALLILAATGGGLAIREIRARRVAAKVVLRFGDSFSFGSPPTLEEEKALWLLHGASPLAKKRAIEAFLDNDTTARRMLAHHSLILHSISGLRPERMAGGLQDVWERRCWEELQNLEPSQKRACAVIEDELPAADPDTWSAYFKAGVAADTLISLFMKLPPSAQDRAFVLIQHAIKDSENPEFFGDYAGAFLSRAPAEIRRRRGRDLVASLAAAEGTSGIEALRRFRSSLGAVSPEFEPDLVALMERLLRLPQDRAERLRWAKALAGLHRAGWKLSHERKREAKDTLVETLRTDLSVNEKMAIIGELAAFHEELHESDRETAKEIFLKIFKSCDARETSLDLQPVAWLFDSLSSQEALAVLLVFFDNFDRRRNYNFSAESLHGGLQSLGRRIDGGEKSRVLESYRARLLAADSLAQALPLLVLIGNLQAGDAAIAREIRNDLATEVVRLVETEQARGKVSVDQLPTILLSFWPDWDAADRRRIELALRELYKQYVLDKEKSHEAEQLANLLEQLEIVLPVRETKGTFELLLGRSRLPCEVLAPLVTNDTVTLVVEQALRHPTCPLGISPAVTSKLEKLGLFRTEEIGWRYYTELIVERRKLAAWAQENGYELDEPLPFEGVRD